MIGMKYLRYHPKPVHQLPSGLTLFQSSFYNPNGEHGIMGGPHKVFTDVQKNFFNSSNTSIFLNSRCDIFRREFSQETDVPLLGYGEDHLLVNESQNPHMPIRQNCKSVCTNRINWHKNQL